LEQFTKAGRLTKWGFFGIVHRSLFARCEREPACTLTDAALSTTERNKKDWSKQDEREEARRIV
jgi:hypothetical protein